ncbi:MULTISPECIES: hypothetical protein [unclassified Duganella]|uniref:hypothetical protein n=1 Tax=unclassified Duganella TaxID=2636909 RepID=UPI000AF70B50|nr:MULTISPECIES: hypothetical protein [unclassified Duganella]
MQLVIKLAPEISQVKSRADVPPFTPELRRTLTALALDLHPMHPGSSDPDLTGFFYTEVADQGAAVHALGLLQQAPGVQSAYLKPRDEMP